MKQKKSPTHKIRRRKIIEKALEGKTTTAIAEEMGIGRTTVSRALNSDEMKDEIKSIDNRLAVGIQDAIETVLRSVGNDYKAAYDLLKNFGSMKSRIDLNHAFPAPLVIEKRDGSQVVLGTENDIEECEEGER